MRDRNFCEGSTVTVLASTEFSRAVSCLFYLVFWSLCLATKCTTFTNYRKWHEVTTLVCTPSAFHLLSLGIFIALALSRVSTVIQLGWDATCQSPQCHWGGSHCTPPGGLSLYLFLFSFSVCLRLSVSLCVSPSPWVSVPPPPFPSAVSLCLSVFSPSLTLQ